MQARQGKHCVGGSTSREREREMCVCVLFEFRQFVFFYSGNSSTYFKVLCRSLQKKKKKKSDRTRCLAVSILEYNLGAQNYWVRGMNLAAVLIRLKFRKKEEIAQNHIAVFTPRFYHIFTCIYTVFSHDKAHILKF